MKIKLFRNITWYSGMYLDEISFLTNYTDINDIHQNGYELSKKGYEIDDRANNPFGKIEQFEYINEFGDKVIVLFDYHIKNKLIIYKNFDDIDECITTAQVIQRLGSIQKLYDDVVEIFRMNYEIDEEDNDHTNNS